MAKGRKIINWEQDFFVQQRMVSAIKRVEFVSGRMSYIGLRGCWCNIIVLNAHTSTDEKGDISKNSFFEELAEVFEHFPKHHMKILLGERIFSNRQLGKRVYIRIVMIMVLQ
jgi:hypothetical protein